MTTPAEMTPPMGFGGLHPRGDRMVADPLRATIALGKRASRDGIYIGFIIALLSHTAALSYPDLTTWQMRAAVGHMRTELHAYFWREYEVVVSEPEEQTPEQPTPPPPEPEQVAVQEPLPPEPQPADEPPPPDDDPYADDEEPPPPAKAPDALTADDDAVDMSGDGWEMVDSDGSESTGTGYSAANGKGSEPVRNKYARVGSTGNRGSKGKGSRKPKKKRNLSRGLGGKFTSNCPFPPQADLHQVDRAVVQLMVTVNASGRVQSARVVSDPGYGFGSQARRCMMARSFPPALDSSGRPVTMTAPMNVQFRRR